MKRESLEQLLAAADIEIPPPTGSADLAARVGRRADRLRQFRAATAAVVAISLGVCIWTRALPRHNQMVAEDATAWKADLARLDLVAAGHRQAATKLEQVEERGRRLGLIELQIDQPDVLARVDAARDFAGWVLVHEADRLRTQPARQAEALEIYRRTIELFAGSSAARRAAEQIGSNGA